MDIRKKIGIAFVMILAIGLLTAFYLEEKSTDKETASHAQMERELLPVREEQDKLEKELENLQEEYGKQILGKGSVVILFTGMEEGIYTDIYPIMKEYGYTGVLTLSERRFPGEEGCMSLKQVKELLEAGWTTCIQWEKDKTDEKWLTNLTDRMKESGISKTEVIYFERDSYSSALDSKLQKLGYTVAVHHGEEKLPLVLSRTEEGIWHPGAVGMKGSSPRYKLEEAVSSGGNIVFTVGYEVSEELFDSDTFRAMLKQFDNYSKKDSLLVTDFGKAREYRRQVETGEGTAGAEYEEQKAVIEQRLSELAEEYQNIIEKYR